MKFGDRVLVLAYGGEELQRCVVEEGDGFVVVCREEEFLAARQEGRKPRGVGFQKRYVLGSIPTETKY